VSGAACRRVYLDREIDRRMDRVRCEDEKEHYNMCQASNAIIDDLEAQRRVYI
jgi:hypothetical protein